MRKMRKAVSLLLAAALMLTTIVGSNDAQAAKKTSAKVSSVKITNAGKTMRLQKGKTFKLKTSVKVKPNKSKYKKVKFTSSNRKVVLVNSRGKMKGVKVGTAKITAASRIDRKKKAVISVSVTKDVLVSSIKLNRTKITAEEYSEEEIPLKVTKILPANAKNKEVVWSTDNEEVADVDDDGVVTTGEVGTATITATAADKGGAYATCKVVVTENKSQGSGNSVETEQPPVQEQPGEIAPPADVPTQEPGQSEESPSPEEPEETEPSEPGDVTAEPTKAPTLKPTEAPALKPTEAPTQEPTGAPSASPTDVPVIEPGASDIPNVTFEPVLSRKVTLKNSNVYHKEDLEDEEGNRDMSIMGTEHEDGSITFHTSALYSGGGMAFYLNDDRTPFDWTKYSKVVVTLSSPQENTDMVVALLSDLPGPWTEPKELEDSIIYGRTSGANEESRFVIDLDEVTKNPENDGVNAYGVFVKYNGFHKPSEDATEEEQLALKKTITIKSIELIAKGEVSPEPVLQKLNNPQISDGGITTWDCVYFGNYWQNDTNGDGAADQSDKKEPIKWRVLSVDRDDVFLLADESLDCQPYNEEFTDVTWETCTLRSWLNDSFFREAFTAAEQSAVRKTVVANQTINEDGSQDGGENTEDYVYLLSREEIGNGVYGFSTDYFDPSPARGAKNTAYTIARGARTSTIERYAGNGTWWLRTSTSYGLTNSNSVHYSGGMLIFPGNRCDTNGIAVRPVLHLNLSAGSNWSYAGTVTGKLSVPFVPDASATPDPYVPEGDGWRKLDLSSWSGAEDHYSEEGDRIYLSDTTVESLPIPDDLALDKVGDKLEVLVCGSLSAESSGFRFWLANEDNATLSQQYYYTEESVGIGADSGNTDRFNPGQSFRIQTVLEHTNHDGVDDDYIRATRLLMKAPSYDGLIEGVTITGIWIRRSDAIPTPDPDKKVENVTLTYDYEFLGPRMVRFDGTVVNHEDEENANVEGYPADGIDVRCYDKVIVKYESGELRDYDGWYGKAALNSTDEGLGQSEFSDGLFTKWFNDVEDTKVKYQDGVYTVEYDIDEDHLNIEFDPEEVGLIDCISVQLANEEDYAGFKLKSIEFISNDNIDADEYELDVQKQLWTNDCYKRKDNPDGSVTLTLEDGDTEWVTGEFGFAIPRDMVGNQHKLRNIIIKYRDADLTGTEIDETTGTCGYIFHLGDKTDVGYIEGEGMGTDPDLPDPHYCELLFNGTGETVITADRNEKNFSTIRIFNGKIGGKITIESIRLVKEGLSGVETPKPTPTPDPWTPSEDAGWVKLDLSQWSGGEGNYLETGDQIILNDTGLETLPLPTSLENLGDKVEVLIRGSVSEDSDGFRFWLANEDQATRSGLYFYTSVDGEKYWYGESAGDHEERQIGDYKPGESFHIQTVFENVNWDNETDIAAVSMLLKGPVYYEPDISIGNIKGVTITGIWVRYGDEIGTTVEDPTIKEPVVDTPTVEIS